MLDKKSLSSLGSIIVYFYRVKQVGRAMKVKRSMATRSGIEQKTLNELAKATLLTHSVKYYLSII